MNQVRTALIALCMALAPLTADAQTNRMRTVGYASFYHDRFHGRPTASGKIYHRDSMTCAHLRFPFGTMLRVTNLRTGKEVVVEVTDRGPYSKKLVIDLSMRAAKELGIYGTRPAKVVLTPIRDIYIPFKVEQEEKENIVDSLFVMDDFQWWFESVPTVFEIKTK